MRLFRRFLTIMVLFLLFGNLWAGTPTPYKYSPFLMIGHIDSDIHLSVDIDDSVLPIDFSSDTVKHNSSPESHVSGLKIGTFSVIANSSFSLYISHTPFELRTPMEEDDSKEDEIDYVLYAFKDMQTGDYAYCYGNANASNPAQIDVENGSILITKNVDTFNVARMINHSLFLTLVDPEKSVSTYLLAGIYESTIYFVLETE